MRTETEGNRATLHFDSVRDLVESASNNQRGVDVVSRGIRGNVKFSGAKNWDDAVRIAKEGVTEKVPDAKRIADEAVRTIEMEHEMPSFQSFYDVSGADVDVARYLTGEPENMINYSMVSTPRAGRVITLVASFSVSGGISVKELEERGIKIVATILAIERVGFQVELYAELMAKESGDEGRLLVKVKGTSEELDIANIMYMYTHPSALRVMGFAGMHLFPSRWRKSLGVGDSYGMPASSKDGFPDGTVFLPHLDYGSSGRDIISETLRELGIID